MMASYAFPLLSRFRNDTKSVLKNALIFSVAYLPRTVLIVVINVLPWALLLTNLYLFLQVGFIWVAVYFAAAAYINTRLLKRYSLPTWSRRRKNNDRAENRFGGSPESQRAVCHLL